MENVLTKHGKSDVMKINNGYLLDAMKDAFSVQDVVNIVTAFGRQKYAAFPHINKWLKLNKVERIERGHYRKIKSCKPGVVKAEIKEPVKKTEEKPETEDVHVIGASALVMPVQTNPLASFSENELLKELKRRGYKWSYMDRRVFYDAI